VRSTPGAPAMLRDFGPARPRKVLYDSRFRSGRVPRGHVRRLGSKSRQGGNDAFADGDSPGANAQPRRRGRPRQPFKSSSRSPLSLLPHLMSRHLASILKRMMSTANRVTEGTHTQYAKDQFSVSGEPTRLLCRRCLGDFAPPPRLTPPLPASYSTNQPQAAAGNHKSSHRSLPHLRP